MIENRDGRVFPQITYLDTAVSRSLRDVAKVEHIHALGTGVDGYFELISNSDGSCSRIHFLVYTTKVAR